MVPLNNIIIFSFTRFDLVNPGDFVEVFDGKDNNAVVLKKFDSKPALGSKWMSQGRFLMVKFKSDGKYSDGKGFEFSWEAKQPITGWL